MQVEELSGKIGLLCQNILTVNTATNIDKNKVLQYTFEQLKMITKGFEKIEDGYIYGFENVLIYQDEEEFEKYWALIRQYISEMVRQMHKMIEQETDEKYAQKLKLLFHKFHQHQATLFQDVY